MRRALTKSRSVLPVGVFLLQSWLGCSGNNGGSIHANAPPIGPQDPSKQGSPIVADKFEFNREQTEVAINSTTKIIEKTFTEENSDLKFRDDVSFPQFDRPITSSQSEFNTAVRQRASKEFESYKSLQLRPRSKAERFPRYHEDDVEFLQVGYDLPLVTDKLANVRFYASTYGRGAGHPVDYFFAFNFDLESGREVKLRDLFVPGSNYLGIASEYSKQIVTERICRQGGWGGTFEDCLKNAPLWEEGIRPTSKNFKAWTICKEGLLFSFDPCQLTGCASGEFYVVVPYSKLKGLARPSSPIAAFTADANQ